MSQLVERKRTWLSPTPALAGRRSPLLPVVEHVPTDDVIKSLKPTASDDSLFRITEQADVVVNTMLHRIALASGFLRETRTRSDVRMLPYANFECAPDAHA
jgi:hypothetical protein